MAVKLSAASVIHGGDRQYQQDQLLLLPHPKEKYKGWVLALISDGMGGLTGGRKASNQVVLTAEQIFLHTDLEKRSPNEILKQIVEEAHTIIKLTAMSSEQEPHGTIAAVMISPKGECFWVHVGDSRIYHCKKNNFVCHTKDHSYVQMLVTRGEITERQARDHPKSNILLSALGINKEIFIDYHHIPVMVPGDHLLICSDGVWHYFENEEIATIMNQGDAEAATQKFYQLSRERAKGGGDNLSLIVTKAI